MSWEPYFIIIIFNFDSLNAAAVKFSVVDCKGDSCVRKLLAVGC